MEVSVKTHTFPTAASLMAIAAVIVSQKIEEAINLLHDLADTHDGHIEPLQQELMRGTMAVLVQGIHEQVWQNTWQAMHGTVPTGLPDQSLIFLQSNSCWLNMATGDTYIEIGGMGNPCNLADIEVSEWFGRLNDTDRQIVNICMDNLGLTNENYNRRKDNRVLVHIENGVVDDCYPINDNIEVVIVEKDDDNINDEPYTVSHFKSAPDKVVRNFVSIYDKGDKGEKKRERESRLELLEYLTSNKL